jgi:hypothetical protein
MLQPGKVRLDLSRAILKQIEQGQKVAQMSATVMPPADPLVTSMASANTDLVAKAAAQKEAQAAAPERDAGAESQPKGAPWHLRRPRQRSSERL